MQKQKARAQEGRPRMKIDFTVTKRDKKLLAGLAACAAAFGVYWFGVRPVTEHIDNLEIQQEQLELEELQMQVRIAALPVDRAHFEEQEDQLDQLGKHFFEYQANEELNRYLTDVFVREGMTMQDSTLRAGQTDEIPPYSLSDRMKLVKETSKNSQNAQNSGSASDSSASSQSQSTSGNSSTQAGAASSTKNAENSAWTQTDYVYTALADYSAIGTKEQALAVLDELASKEGVRIDSFSISDAAVKTTQGEQDTLQAGKRLEVSLAIYMIRGDGDGK